MKELIRTNNAVLLTYIDVLLRDSGIAHSVLDGNMSIVEGSLGVLQQRVLVSEGDFQRASRLLIDAGIKDEGEGG